MTEAIDPSTLKPGFNNPVRDSQFTFRSILRAMSFPGRVEKVDLLADCPAPLMPATASVCLGLADSDTPIWLDPRADQKTVRDFLRFHCNSPLAQHKTGATFAIVTDPEKAPQLTEFAVGSEISPEMSTLVIVQISSFSSGKKTDLYGPGIKDIQRFSPDGLPSGFWQAWEHVGEMFPLGVDILFTCGTMLAALPRTTRVRM